MRQLGMKLLRRKEKGANGKKLWAMKWIKKKARKKNGKCATAWKGKKVNERNNGLRKKIDEARER